MFQEPINYVGTVIRPPSEAESLILQVTLGCSDNNCIFCPAYKDKPFKIKALTQIEEEIKTAGKYFPETRRIFLADGDAIIIPQQILLKILNLLNINFSKLTRVALYGSCKSIKTKTVTELAELRKNKLTMIYIGIESGDDAVYKMINKYGTPEEVAKTIIKTKESGIKTNVTIILGLGGKNLSKQHAENTAKLLNKSQPEQIAALTLMIAPGTALYDMKKENKFAELDKLGYIEELKTIIENLNDFPCLFFSNHASNYLPVQARFPKDKPEVLKALSEILRKKSEGSFRPEWMRGL